MRPVYCDESIWIPVADGLERRGWLVRTARGEGNLGLADRQQLSIVTDNDWLLVTFDDDFLSLVEGRGFPHAGIIYVQQAGRRVGTVVTLLDSHLAERDDGDRSIAYL